MSIRRFKPARLQQWDTLVRADSLFRVLIEVLFDHENRIRALEGKAPITKNQALQAFKQRLRDL